ncbi:MAG: hypothetical protein A3G71_00350 [Gammaproteobacteria bacterium RIFCSPLOWO2_12_FULL_38_14]|nr:MAG: hypothetical protein A3B69_06005 [Gammaproteobacteria bacterium RIFCSPHIGHO2_02_FULL_38_33]OGT75591.1 MAG: hypothetical protein A3G71_00350 [Gammaproteobacteria bacterium RIFCSPLOWO2_12_FULL_38_14]
MIIPVNLKLFFKHRFLLLFFMMMPSFVFALTYPLEKGISVIGRVQTSLVEPGDNFNIIARRFDVGYYDLIEANPKLEPEKLPIWYPVVIPTKFIIPEGEQKGIIVNLPELRLYYFPQDKEEVITFPLGVGRQGTTTPVCLTKITIKTRYPTWYVPESIRMAREQEGVHLPKLVLPGPDNPLGDYSLRLEIPNGAYLMHGTNDSSGVGRRSSAGCIRMFPEDIEELFALVEVGTPVNIIDDPLKIGWDGKFLYLESHQPLDSDKQKIDFDAIVEKISKEAKKRNVKIDWEKARKIAKDQNGIPETISVSDDAY